VVEIVPPTRLVITWANASQANDPDATSRVSFDVVPYDDMLRLTVTHDELEAGSGGDPAGLADRSVQPEVFARDGARHRRLRQAESWPPESESRS
jgi:uncharacterized protein YndB with AHSA1/START domain